MYNQCIIFYSKLQNSTIGFQIKIGYSEEMGIQAIQFFYDRSRTPVCGNFDPENEIKTSSIVFDNEEACKIDYLAGNENEDGGINGLTFHFDCK